MKRILYVSGTRADYGLMRAALFRIKRQSGFKLDIAAGGMHLMPEFGSTVNEIYKDRFNVHQVNAVYKEDDKESMAVFVGEFTIKLTGIAKKIKPAVILILGDRAEMLASAVVGAYLTIPVAHIHGGDVTSTVDETARHAITKLSHIHLAATKKAARRIIRMGEDPWRVHVVGAPGLDGILRERLFPAEEMAKKYSLDLLKPILLVINHPAAEETENAGKQAKEVMEAITECRQQAVVVYPNADAGGRKIIKVIEGYRKYPFIHTFKSIPRGDYLSLMRIASAMVGNSSSGIIEAPSFCLPAVNIGRRQDGRERAGNVIDVDHDKNRIKAAIGRAICDTKFKRKARSCVSPYGNGRAGEKIVKILSKMNFDKKLLHKKINY